MCGVCAAIVLALVNCSGEGCAWLCGNCPGFGRVLFWAGLGNCPWTGLDNRPGGGGVRGVVKQFEQLNNEGGGVVKYKLLE